MGRDDNSSYLEIYERLLWNLLCRRHLLHGKISDNKAKRLAVLAYCLYYRGVTVWQIMMSGMSDSANESVVRITMSKYATSDIRCCVMPKSHVSEDVEGIAPVSSKDQTRPYFVHQVIHGRARMNIYELSEYGISTAIYDLLGLPAEFLAGVNSQVLTQMAKRFRKRKSLRFSDEAMHLISVRDVGAYCIRMLDFKPFVYRTECRIFENGAFMADGSPGALASTAQICDGYIDFVPVTRRGCDPLSVFVEQDMGTQSRGYLRKNKLMRYSEFVRYSFNRHPALVTLLFSFQTRAGFRPSGSVDATLSSAKNRYAPALRQELIIRAAESYGDRWQDTLLSVFRKQTAETMRACPAVQTHLQHELELFDELLSQNEIATIGDCVNAIGASNRPSFGSQSMMEPRDRFYFKTRRLEIFEESLHVPGFRDALLDGFSVMFTHNKCLPLHMPCLLPELSGVCSDGALGFPLSVATERFCRLISRVCSSDVSYLDYRPFARSSERLFRNYYYNEDLGIHILLENISDDLGGRARVMDYLSDPSFSLFKGYLICLVEDDWLDPLAEPVRNRRSDFFYSQICDSAYAGYLLDYAAAGTDPYSRIPLRVIFVTYRAFSSADVSAGVMEIVAGNGGINLRDLEV